MENKKLRLPKTGISTRANVIQTEKDIAEYWKRIELYKLLNNRSSKSFTLHFGPPFANGNLHMGHGLTYTIKSIILAAHGVLGYKVSNILGWDCHGLPIETKARSITSSKKELYKECQHIAKYWMQQQESQLRALCFIADDRSYSTMNSLVDIYSAFSKLLLQNKVYIANKPLIWSTHYKCNVPAIDIEYRQKKSLAIYVLFPMEESNTYALIYTTTPWSLWDNMAICINKNAEYLYVKYDNKIILVQKSCDLKHILDDNYEIISSVLGKDLLSKKYFHIFTKEKFPILHGDHVSEVGTGLVHTAPSHGLEDYEVFCRNFDSVLIRDSVSEDGFINIENQRVKFTDNDTIIEFLKPYILYQEKIQHSYPFYKNDALIYKTSRQIYLKIESVKSLILNSLKSIHTTPSNLKERMLQAIDSRSEWCVSRNRTYGVPLALFVHKDSGELLINEKLQQRIIEQMQRDLTFFLTDDCISILNGIVDENDYEYYNGILDCWFDSGCVSSIILKKMNENPVADVYIEGKDQIRGWFNSAAFLTALLDGRLPYNAIGVHGFILAENNEKMSKSKGNGISLQDVLEKYGLNIFSILIGSSDFKNDVKISNDALDIAQEQYRKFFNVLRYLCSIVEYKDSIQEVEIEEELEKCILLQLREVIEEYIDHMEAFEIHFAFNCVKEFIMYISSTYFNARKDVLYLDGDTYCRDQIIYTSYLLLQGLLGLLVAFMPHTCEKLNQYLRDKFGNIFYESIFMFNLKDFIIPSFDSKYKDSVKYLLNNVVPIINGKMDLMKKDYTITRNEDAICFVNDDRLQLIKLLTRCSEIYSGDSIEVVKSNKIACERCYIRLGHKICDRCKTAIKIKST